MGQTNSNSRIKTHMDDLDCWLQIFKKTMATYTEELRGSKKGIQSLAIRFTGDPPKWLQLIRRRGSKKLYTHFYKSVRRLTAETVGYQGIFALGADLRLDKTPPSYCLDLILFQSGDIDETWNHPDTLYGD